MSDLDFTWKCHLPNLLGEILHNPGTEMLYRPLQATAMILDSVAERASKLNDPIMNYLMCRLTMYSVADPLSPEFDIEVLKQIKRAAVEQMKKEAATADALETESYPDW